MSGWGCPHEVSGTCSRIKGLPCDPGMKGCVLFGRFVWSSDAKNRSPRPAPQPLGEGSPAAGDDGDD
jgi:hypothetical protein